MKNIILFILSILTIIIVNLNLNDSKDTEVIITIPNLTYNDISTYLKNEFNKHPNIDYIEGSLASKTIVLKVNQHDFNLSHIENLLNKWGCVPTEFDFNHLSDVSIND